MKLFFLFMLVCQDNWNNVMFTAYTTSVSTASGNTIMFDNDGGFQAFKLNYKNSFDYSNGVFTTPINGTYAFSLTRNAGSGYGTIAVERNESKELQFHGGEELYDSIVPSWLMMLNKGDRIRLTVTNGNISSAISRYTIWSGRLQNNNGVAFSSFVDFYDIDNTGILSFTKSHFNTGNGFNSNIFKVPRGGIYEFSFMANSNTGYGQVKVMKNGFVKLTFFTRAPKFEASGPSWIMHLQKGDEIWLNVTQGSIASDTDMNRVFNGILLYPDFSDGLFFCVYHNSSWKSTGYLTFENVLVSNSNRNNMLTATNSKFTAPVTGTYEFAFTANSAESDYGHVSVYRNTEVHYQMYSSKSDKSTIGSKWIMDLQKGDYIRLNANKNIHTDSSYNRIFSGKLIQKLHECESSGE